VGAKNFSRVVQGVEFAGRHKMLAVPFCSVISVTTWTTRLLLQIARSAYSKTLKKHTHLLCL